MKILYIDSIIIQKLNTCINYDILLRDNKRKYFGTIRATFVHQKDEKCYSQDLVHVLKDYENGYYDIYNFDLHTKDSLVAQPKDAFKRYKLHYNWLAYLYYKMPEDDNLIITAQQVGDTIIFDETTKEKINEKD